jgi:bacteriocin-like protein
MTMNTDKLESTGNVSLSKRGTSAYDLNELSDRELQLVTGGAKGGPGAMMCDWYCYVNHLTPSECNEHCRTGAA